MRNILATSFMPPRLSRPSAMSLVLAASMVGSTLWGVWATDRLLALEKRAVVAVQLARIMGDFVDAEARAGRPPEQTRMRVAAYLKAVEASVEKLGKDGRTVLVAEAVVAGSAPDLTEQVRTDVARRMGALGDARR